MPSNNNKNNSRNNAATATTSPSSYPPPPPLKVFCRSKDGVELYEVPKYSNPSGSSNKGKKQILLRQPGSTFHALSPDGQLAIVHVPSIGIIRLDLKAVSFDGDETPPPPPAPFLKDSEKVQCAYFSPRGTYIVTWERPQKPTNNNNNNNGGGSNNNNTPPRPNLNIWSSSDGSLLRGYHSKSMPQKLSSQNQQQSTALQMSLLQWTPDESRLFRLVSNEVQIYSGHLTADSSSSSSDAAPVSKIICPQLSSFSLSPTHLVTFTPESKGKPARVSLYDHSTPTAKPLSSKSFFQTEECAILWCPNNTHALALTQTTVDATGESYYGSSHLYLITPTADVIQVPLPNKLSSPLIQDVAWNPSLSPNNTKTTFALISGKMPAMISLHRGDNAQPLFLFGEYHRNVVSWSPHGRFVAFGGFGNLAGNVDVWDRNKLKMCGSFAIGCAAVGWGWGGDSRVFGVSVTSPRMNVENGVRCWTYHGGAVANEGEKENTPFWTVVDEYGPDRLLQCEFVPVVRGVYEDRPQSPERKLRGEVKSVESSREKARQSYVPPAARRAAAAGGRGGGSGRGGMTLAEKMRREKEGTTAGAMRVSQGGRGGYGRNGKKIPGLSVGGAATVGASAGGGGAVAQEKSKSAKIRERQKAAKQRAMEEEKKKQQQQKKEEESNKDEKTTSSEDPEKRAKKIKKTLKQIKELKMKDASTLNEDQKKKMDMEKGLLEELKSLGL